MNTRLTHFSCLSLLSILLLLRCSPDANAAAAEVPDDAATVQSALADLEAGRMFEGMGKLRELVRRNPRHGDAHLYLGMVYSRMRQYDFALRYVKRAIELDPDKGAYYNQLGVLWTEQRRFKEALEAFLKAVKSKFRGDEELQKAWQNLGYCHRELLQWDEAIRAYQRAIELQPRVASAHLSLGEMYLDRNRLDEAIQELALGR